MIPEIRIRPYEPGDAQQLYEAARESAEEVSRWTQWTQEYTLECAESRIAARISAFENKTEYNFAILDVQERLLGGCGLNRIDAPNDTANLGYWVRPSRRCRGVATTAVTLLRDWAFENTELHRLEVLVSVQHVASLRVAEKSGAVREGVLRQRLKLRDGYHDAVMHSLIKAVLR